MVLVSRESIFIPFSCVSVATVRKNYSYLITMFKSKRSRDEVESSLSDSEKENKKLQKKIKKLKKELEKRKEEYRKYRLCCCFFCAGYRTD